MTINNTTKTIRINKTLITITVSQVLSQLENIGYTVYIVVK